MIALSVETVAVVLLMLGMNSRSIQKGLLGVLTVSYIFASTFRTGFVDTASYVFTYRQVNSSWEIAQNEASNLEPTFLAFMWFLNRISDDPRLFLFVVAVLVNGGMALFLLRYSDHLPVATMMYFVGFYLATNNQMRQSLAAVMIALAFGYLLDGRLVRYALVVLLASLAHSSSLIMIPLYFLIRRRAFHPFVMAFLAVSLAGTLAPGILSGILNPLLETTKYGDYMVGETYGMKPARILINALPLVGLLLVPRLGRQSARDSGDVRVYDVLVNVAVVVVAVSLLATGMVYFSRILILLAPLVCLVLGWQMKRIATDPLGGFLAVGLIAAQWVAFALDLLKFEQDGYLPGMLISFEPLVSYFE